MAADAVKLSVVTLEDVKQAALRIKPHVHRTPIITSKYLDGLSGRKLFFKCENFQKTGAFKIRGATNAILQHLERNKGQKPIVVTHSSGNHAQGVSFAAKCNNLTAKVVMPCTSPQAKKDAAAGYGGDVIECGPTQQHREEAAQKILQELGKDAFFLSSSDNLDLIAGQGTMGLEMLEDVPDLDALVVPVGGGGMLSGICIAAKGINPNIKIFAAEPKNADDCAKSFAAKKRIPNQSPPETVAEGLKVNVGKITWPIICDNITDVITVEEDEIINAMKIVFERMKLVIETSAAVPVAAVLSERFRNVYSSFERIGVVLSGGNVGLEKLPWQKF